MNADTDYVHTAVINYEPLYNVLMAVASEVGNGVKELHEGRDELADAVEHDYAGAYLQAEDLDGVDYAEMIQFEIGE